MLKAATIPALQRRHRDALNGVVKSQTDPDLVYACRIESRRAYACCTQNLNICGGLRGSICKHLLVLIIGLVKAGELDPSTIDEWVAKTHDAKPELNKETMGEIFIRYKGAEAGEVDWRPTETVPEDYYSCMSTPDNSDFEEMRISIERLRTLLEKPDRARPARLRPRSCYSLRSSRRISGAGGRRPCGVGAGGASLADRDGMIGRRPARCSKRKPPFGCWSGC